MADNQVEVQVMPNVDTTEIDALEDRLNEEYEIPVETGDLDDAEEKAEQTSEEIERPHDLQVNTEDLDAANDKAIETASTMDSLVTAAAGIGISAGVENMVSTADNINTSWNRLKLTFGETGTSMDTLKAKATEASNATGRSGGTIRSYFNQMGIAGVTNADLLSTSFEALSGRAYQTGNDIGAMENKLQTMVLSGNVSARALKGLGLSAEDLGESMGVTADEVSKAFEAMTPEERLAAISKAMGDGAEANSMYKNSYAGLKDQADAAMAGLAGAVGEAILPIVIPALKTVTDMIKTVADGFRALPGPVQGVIGCVLGFAGIALTAVGVIGTMSRVISSVSTALQVLTETTILQTAVTKLQAAAQWLLNAAMSANPIMLVVIAVIALVAALWYLYNTNETVRAAIDGVITVLGGLAQTILGAVTNAIKWITGLFNNFTNNLGVSKDNWVATILSFIAFLPQLPLRLGVALANAIAKTLGFGNNFVQNMTDTATRGVSGFVNKIAGLPGLIQGEFSRIESIVSNFVTSLPSKVWDLGANVVGALKGALGIGSPGYMYYMLEGEYKRMDDLTKSTSISTSGLGDAMVDDFTPRLGNSGNTSNNTNNITINIDSVDNEDRIREIVKAVEDALAFDNLTAGRTV